MSQMYFLCILRWGELTGLLNSIVRNTNMVLGFTTSGIKPKVEFRLSSIFLVRLQVPNKKSHSFRICKFPIYFFYVCKNCNPSQISSLVLKRVRVKSLTPWYLFLCWTNVTINIFVYFYLLWSADYPFFHFNCHEQPRRARPEYYAMIQLMCIVWSLSIIVLRLFRSLIMALPEWLCIVFWLIGDFLNDTY